MRRFGAFVLAGVAWFGAACGRGVSENPYSGRGEGGGTNNSGGTGGTSGKVTGGATSATGGAGVTGGSASGGESGMGGGKAADGEACEAHDECVSNHCVDRVCCNDACDGLCERCDATGTCVATEEDTACDAPYACFGRDRCRLPNGETCGKAADCNSRRCEPTDNGRVCCETSCEPVVCQSDRCATRTAPAPGTCSGSGACATCEVEYIRKGVPCGVGRRCDGSGACELDGRGRIAAGEHHTCLIDDDANVICWGDNRFGQLGAVFGRQRVGLDEPMSLVPDRTIDFYDDVVQITAGAQHTCALFATGAVRCWGTMYDSPFGLVNGIWGTVDFKFVPDTAGLPPGAVGHLAAYGFINPLTTGDVILAEPAEQISAAPEGATICATLRSGQVSCWGYNSFGGLGIGNTSQPDLLQLAVLERVDLGERVVEVRSALAHTCALTENGRVWCWGDGLYGRLGSGSNGPRHSPGDPVDIGEPAVGLAVGFDHNCVLLERGAVRCWGNNHQGQLGYGHNLAIGDDETPADAALIGGPAGREHLGGDVALDADIVQIVTLPASSVRGSNGIWDSSPTCALSNAHYVKCWGRNDTGQLGYGHVLGGATEHTPVELVDLRESDRFVHVGGDVLALAEGGRCALRVSNVEDEIGSLYCWGPNDFGQVGVNGNSFPSLTQRPIDMGPIHWWEP